MRWTHLRWLGLAGLGAVALGACSSDSVNDATGGAQGAPGGASGGIAAPGGAPNGGSGGGTGGAPSCDGERLAAELPALDLFVVLDASDAMFFSAAGNSTRWGQVTSGLLSFLRDTASTGVGVDLGIFPEPLEDIPDSCTSDEACGEAAPCFTKICLNVFVERGQLVSCDSNITCDHGTSSAPVCRTIGDCSTSPGNYCFTESVDSCDGTCTQSGICSRFVSCRADAYEEPAVPLAELPAGQPDLARAIQMHEPGDQTTTLPALSAALDRARAHAADNQDDEVAVVLLTGGLPTACAAEEATREEAVAELAVLAEAGASDGVKTHVIGVFSEMEIAGGARELLDGVAEAGGTEAATIVDAAGNVSTQVNAALVSLRGLRRGCQFRAPDTADYDLVNVVLSSGSTSSVIPRVANEDACDGDRGGWYYDVDPEGAAPTALSLCATSCVELRLAQGSSVELELGCASQTLDSPP